MKARGEAAGNRVAWITGAGKGIGRALTLRLAKEGWTVAASARTEGDLASLKTESATRRVHCFPLDVTDATATAATVAQIEERFGPLDLAVLNAGTHQPFAAAEFTVEKVRGLVETNLMGTVSCLAPLMERFIARRSGHLAVVASLAGYRGLPTAAAYGASKAGLINMCEALRPDLEGHGVTLTVINPGFVKTPLTDKNEFSMPFLISVEAAVDHIVKGLDKGAFEVTFPKRFAVLMKLLRVLPDPLFFALTRRMIGT